MKCAAESHGGEAGGAVRAAESRDEPRDDVALRRRGLWSATADAREQRVVISRAKGRSRRSDEPEEE